MNHSVSQKGDKPTIASQIVRDALLGDDRKQELDRQKKQDEEALQQASSKATRTAGGPRSRGTGAQPGGAPNFLNLAGVMAPEGDMLALADALGGGGMRTDMGGSTGGGSAA
ncbi:MAG: hypothetical protein IPK13_04790 [Deltaproteobacteria bacterium]|nr:hypothetical protein [Deltaproteobacteria bacterium]